MLANRLQLNTGKTDLLWCATARRCHQLPTSGLRIGSDFVNPSKSVGEILEFTSTPTSACDATFRKPLPAALPFFVSCAAFDVRCRRPFTKHSSSLSSCPDWTTAMPHDPSPACSYLAENRCQLLRCSAPVVQHLMFGADVHLPDACRCPRPVPAGLRQCCAGRLTRLPVQPPPVGTQRCRTIHCRPAALGPHHRHTRQFPLVESVLPSTENISV